MSKYLKNDGVNITLLYPYSEVYIPLEYFGTGSSAFAEDRGDTIYLLGIFYMGFFKNGELETIGTTGLSTWITLNVYEYENRQVDIPHMGKIPCKVLQYYEGNSVMSSYFIQDSANIQKYLNYIVRGKVPRSVSYDKSFELWRNNQSYNGASLGVPAVIEETILSASYRYEKDPTKKFASVIGKDPSVGQYAGMMASIRQICQYTSTLAGITFEDKDSMITSSLNRYNNGIEEPDSDIEEIIKM